MGNVNNKNWSVLSKHRNELFGVSIISIIILHYFQNLYKANVGGLARVITLAYYDVVGSVGVEIFLFLSGMGLYFSLQKDSRVLKFYGRRLKRLLLAYIIWGGTFWAIRDIVILNLGIERFMYDFSFLSFWEEGISSLWFIGFIIPMYLLYPMIHVIFDNRNKLRSFMFLEMLVTCVLATEWMKVHTPNFYQDAKLAIYRVPIFLFGAYFGTKIYEGKDFSLGDKLLVLLGYIMNLLHIIHKHREISFMKYIDVEYVKCFYSISLVITLAYLFQIVKIRALNYVLVSCGALSLELYMTHVNIRNIMTLMGFKLDELWLYVTCVLMSIASSIVLSNICKGILYIIDGKYKVVKQPRIIVIE